MTNIFTFERQSDPDYDGFRISAVPNLFIGRTQTSYQTNFKQVQVSILQVRYFEIHKHKKNTFLSELLFHMSYFFLSHDTILKHFAVQETVKIAKSVCPVLGNCTLSSERQTMFFHLDLLPLQAPPLFSIRK